MLDPQIHSLFPILFLCHSYVIPTVPMSFLCYSHSIDVNHIISCRSREAEVRLAWHLRGHLLDVLCCQGQLVGLVEQEMARWKQHFASCCHDVDAHVPNL